MRVKNRPLRDFDIRMSKNTRLKPTLKGIEIYPSIDISISKYCFRDTAIGHFMHGRLSLGFAIILILHFVL